MKSLTIVLSFVIVVVAEPPSSYVPPAAYSAPSGGYGAPQAAYGAPAYQEPIVHRHVYIHSAPDEATYPETKVIRAGGPPEKHVNIIFVRAPVVNTQSHTEVQLPEQPQQKTLVYVLVKKPENQNTVQVRGPSPTKPTKPEVFFIRYKNEEPVPSYGPPPQDSYGPPPQQPSQAYGAPRSGYN